VIGSASDMVGVWIDPVIAQLMMILLAMVRFSPCRPVGRLPEAIGARAALRSSRMARRSSGKTGRRRVAP
jgi:hypothetical protein